MNDDEALGIATGAETITGANLQASIDALQAAARALNTDLQAAPDFESVQSIGLAQADLNDRALDLVDAQIALLAGQAKLSADHINAATTYAGAAIAAMSDWRRKIAAAGMLVDFVDAVMTGNGAKIVDAAFKLKDVL